jgi:hypothetical protein
MEHSDHSWRGIYTMGCLFTLLVILGILLDILLGTTTGIATAPAAYAAESHFIELRDNLLRGLYHLDALNLFIQVLMMPVFFSLYAIMRKSSRGVSFFAMVVFIIGSAVYLSGNPALGMYELSLKWKATNNEVLRNIYLAAGESVLAKGAHGTPAAFLGSALLSLAGILVSVAMTKGRVFNRLTALLGIFGNSLLLLYLVTITISPSSLTLGIIFAIPGGLLMIGWMLLFMARMYKIANRQGGHPHSSSPQF